MKLLISKQTKEADAYTIKNEPISSIDLMERAATGLSNEIAKRYDNSFNICIFVGPGNNGGDGLAVARLLAKKGYSVVVQNVVFTTNFSDDFKTNKERLIKQNRVEIHELKTLEVFPKLERQTVIVDAMFGSGLSRPLKGLPSEVVMKINSLKLPVVAIDIPSGLFGEENFLSSSAEQIIIKSSLTLTIQLPKLSFFFAETEQYVGQWEIIDIGLMAEFINNVNTPYNIITIDEIKNSIKKRTKFSHKGTFGHALLISGSYGKTGAAVLASKACLRTGVGLLTTHIPKSGYTILQTTIPEAMLNIDNDPNYYTELNTDIHYDAIGVGPGIGLSKKTQTALNNLLNKQTKPMVIDADALNIIALNKELLNSIPKNSILTPHPKEFERLFGKTNNHFNRNKLQLDMAIKYEIYIILKGANTAIACPDGKSFFNTTGNPGMATAGSGDVLTGMILSLLTQEYNSLDAATIGVYIHGLSADLALNAQSQESLIASDIIGNIGMAFNHIIKSSSIN